jgi:hypothetical protein
LGEDRTSDILTRWLAHHTAGLIEAADHARAEGDTPDADARAASARGAILELWQHRSAWPNGWPPPRSVALVRLLEDVPDLGSPGLFQANLPSQLQALHHHVLAVLADLVTVDVADVEEGWLRAFGDQLTPDETTLLMRAAGAPRRLQDLHPRDESKISGLTRRSSNQESHRAAEDEQPGGPGSDLEYLLPLQVLVQLANAYRDTIIDLVQGETAPSVGDEVDPSDEDNNGDVGDGMEDAPG